MLLAFFVLSCNQVRKESPVNGEVHEQESKEKGKFDWLLGKWVRSNEEEGLATYEFWDNGPGPGYQGLGFTLKAGDTIWQETMSLEKELEEWVLVIVSPGEKEPVKFRMTSQSDTTFTCENPSMDFPKKISYRKKEGGFMASVSNLEMEIPFEFKSAVE